MRYFIDTEFIEDFHKPWFGKRRHFIDLISIAIVTEDGREYYAISNEFDVDAVWNKFEIEKDFGKPQGLGDKKVYWLRDNVLMPIFYDLFFRNRNECVFTLPEQVGVTLEAFKKDPVWSKDLWWFKKLIKMYGKSNKQIAAEILMFVKDPDNVGYKKWLGFSDDYFNGLSKMPIHDKPEFYGYYADYDWVLFCSLFGRMIDLPVGFQRYCHDLKQMLDSKIQLRMDEGYGKGWFRPTTNDHYDASFEECLSRIKNSSTYPKNTNEHSALADAHWNMRLYQFIKSL